MKRWFKLFCTVFLLGIILVACGQGGEPGGQTNDPSTGSEHPDSNQDDQITDDDQGLGEDDLAPNEQEEGEEHTVTLYFADTDLMKNYRVHKTVTVKEGENVAQVALQAWVEGPEQEGLTTLIPKEVVVEYVEEKDGIAEVSFSKEILNANVGSAGELLIMEQIAMIMDQFGYRKTQVLVEGEVVETLFGHMSADEPIQAGNPDDFEWADQ